VPPCLTKSLAFLIGFYHCDTYANGAMTGKRGDESYSIQDDEAVLKFYAAHKNTPAEELIPAVLSNEDFWGENLDQLPGLEETVKQDLACILEKGAYQAMKSTL
jgi:tagaturonate reductase